MIIRLVMLAELVAITAALAMPENLQSLGLASFILATAALVVAIFPSSASHGLAKLLRPGLVVVLAAPALWMALQVVPMPMDTLGNPIWATASAALNEPLTEIISVDIGATMLSLAQYCAVLAAALVTAVITLDRYRAAQVLHILLAITTVATAMWFGKEATVVAGPDGSTVAVLGVLLSCATAIRAVDQLRRHSRPGKIAPTPLPALSAAVIAIIVCMAALLIRTNSTAVVAALLGSGILVSVFAIRRWFMGLWGTAAVLATAAIFSIASLTVIPFRTNTDVTIALSTSSQIATERMLQDVRPAGSGAGASMVLLPLYRDIGIGAPRERPTAAAAMVIDMGWAFLCGLVVIAMLGACILIRRSLSRAYDYVYPALGAGASIAVPILAFADHGILGLGASLLVAALFGLAFGQSVSSAGREAKSLESEGASDWMAGPAPASRPRLAPAFITLWARAALAMLGTALIIQTIWMVLPGWYLGGQSSLSAVSAAAAWPNGISKPVSAAAAHEDLWIRGESRSRGDPALAADEQKTELPAASNAFARALRSSPLRGDIWLMLAAAPKQNSIQTAAMLKMSYYTAPNDLDLLPLRLSVALATDAVVRELEFRDLIKRDVSLVVTRRPAIRPALLAAYRSASAEGKIYLENLISELDPTYLDNMRARNSRQGSR
ncbi:hypothetical protein BST63_03990 [Bradyrhizobium canariense]|uniref:O-Antigen ligase n=2 Tax=Bradyrhizobium canariense TaxID=255045 RepID=A0ABX3X9S4_9BRAD|nr:hypothetical protein BSR47_04495 [Bradyrhizobium canariense]OSJ34207.1 hypothetical protein BST63_03990 [Bradyrhizobium canariense]